MLPVDVQRLVDQFGRNYESYKASKYNETQLRREFLDPFFEALGWDVSNKKGIAEQYKEVIHEDAIKINQSIKAPDYCFRVGSDRKFFVEAKKPSVNIREGVNPAYQLRRYAWSAKLPLSILTDFDEFAIYDCRVKPRPTDKASVGRILYFKFDEIKDYWEEFSNVFSRDAVWQGSFDKYADDNSKKKGTSEVDNEFLKDLEIWREKLAKNIALRNKGISTTELNFAVQRTLDRILFFRISEDRGIEDVRKLSETLGAKEIYSLLCEMFKFADDKYNSGLFHFHKNNDRPTPPDELSLSLKIDDKVLKEIIQGLYYPVCPYEFSVMSVEILGQVYERFLGKEIQVTKGGKVNVVDKPLVKKAGGVFYTPSYIVAKIVDDTLGPILSKKSPKQIENVKILDPACGSGSFLIGVYDYLLKWHLDKYLQGDKKYKNKIYQNVNNEWCLTPKEKKKILTNNIFGVDIDPQAVETTKLSLCLKVLEGETKESLERQLTLFGEHALPDIGDNIKCGNSLVGQDLDIDRITNDELYKINPFDWDAEFPSVFTKKDTGFDVIVGNPPYLRVQGLNEFHGNEIAYYQNKFKSAVKRYDLYLLFIERCFFLLGKEGVLGFICPHKFTNSDFGSGIRSFLTEERALFKFINFNSNLIFDQASTYTCLLYLSKRKNKKMSYIEVPKLSENGMRNFLFNLKPDDFTKVSIASLGEEKWSLSEGSSVDLISKLKGRGYSRIGECFQQIMQGIVTGNDDTHILTRCKVSKNYLKGYSKELGREIEIELGITRPLITGKTPKRNQPVMINDYCIYPYYLNKKGKTQIYEESELKAKFPMAFEYLSKFKKALTEKKKKYKTNEKYWYSCHRGRKIDLFERETVITPEISLGGNMTIASKEHYHNSQGYSFIQREDDNTSIYYWLGILNSKIVWWYLTKTGTVLRGGYFRFKEKYLSPIPVPDPKTLSDELLKSITDKSKSLYVLNRDLSEKKSLQDKEFITRRIRKIEEELEKEILKA